MPNKLPKFLDNHKICIICEGNEEYEYLNRLKDLKVWNEQYEISLVNAGGNGNIPGWRITKEEQTRLKKLWNMLL